MKKRQIEEPFDEISQSPPPLKKAKDLSTNDTMLLSSYMHDDITGIEEALKNGANPNFIFNNIPFIFYPVFHQQELIIKLCIKYRANLNLEDSKGNTPLDFMTHQSNQEIIKLLINNKALFSNYKYCENMLISYVFKKNIDMVDFLLHAGANPHIVIDTGFTPLHIAIDNDDVGMVEVLLKNGMKPNFNGFKHPTALILAIQKNNVKAVEILLKAGADYRAKDGEDVDAKELAKTLECKEVVNLISLYQDIDLISLYPKIDSFFLTIDRLVLNYFSLEEFKNPQIIGQQTEDHEDI